ncbi:MAG: EAL and HDOD domain-containing protein [Planctomyces sp.]
MDAFIARQPIFDRDLAVYGYELLFRNGAENFFRPVDGNFATQSLISDAVHLHSIEKITEGRRCFINFTRESILSELYAVLPAGSTVVEVLETVEISSEIIQACRKLREQGFTLALDDYVLDPGFNELLPLVDILKVEFPALSADQHAQITKMSAEHRFMLLAEKVETQDQFLHAKALGYHLFQGYFFCRPSILKTKRIPESHAQSLRLLQLVNQPEFQIQQIEELIRSDVGMSYKLLRYMNSPIFGQRSSVQSIRQAVTALGQRALRKWVSLLTVNSISTDKPTELTNTSLIRARFCELCGENMLDRSNASDCFTSGLFSLLDAMLDQPIELLIEELNLSESTRTALLGQTSAISDILSLAVAMEKADWPRISRFSEQYQIPEKTLFQWNQESVDWVHALLTT